MAYVKKPRDQWKIQDYRIFRNNLREYMALRGVTINRLEQVSLVSETTIKQIRRHRQEPEKSTRQLLAAALQVEEDKLFPRIEVVGIAAGKKKYRMRQQALSA